jgi:CheY-like chemotaxis protein
MKEEKKQELFKEFLSSGDILIADKSSASRRRLTKTIVDMGGSRSRIDSVAHFSEAIDIIRSKKPKLLLSDYDLNGGSGFDLFKEYRESFPEEKKSVLILVTSNISQSAVAKAAEEDVDSFIIKPYTVKSLEKSLINTVIGKLYPSKYVQAIEKGKELLFQGNYEEALDVFEEAIKLNEKPSLAMFYHGQTKYMLEQLQEAEGDYKKGLEINSIHFKCQVGLYELFMKDQKFHEAYSVVKNIAKYFPANPDRLKEVVRLAMVTENYVDMEMYYDIFTQLDERTDDVINFVCSGMFINGKFHFIQGDKDKAREIFDKIGVSCSGMSKFLTAMIKLLAENEYFDDAQKLVSRFSNDPQEKNSYMVAKYIAYSNVSSLNERISQGLELWNNGVKDLEAFLLMYNSLLADNNEQKASEYLEEARRIWPKYFQGNATKAA